MKEAACASCAGNQNYPEVLYLYHTKEVMKRAMRKTIIIAGAAICIICAALISYGFMKFTQRDAIPSRDLTLSEYPKLFAKGAVIVIGENASEIERQAAEEIKNFLLKHDSSYIKVIDSQKIKSFKRGYNLVIIGTPKTNPLLEEVYAMTNVARVTEEFPGEGKGVLEILRNPWDEEKAMLLVEGSDEWGVKAGREILVKDEETLQGKIIITEQVKEDFTYAFTWGHDEQDIVPGTLCINITRIGQTRFVVKINDNDYNEWDYLVMVFDQNQNGIVDLGNADQPYGLWANNLTSPAVLLEKGYLSFAEIPPKAGPHKCTFDSNTGYTFDVSFPTLPDVKFILLRIGFVDKDVPYGDIGVVTTDDIKICLQDFDIDPK